MKVKKDIKPFGEVKGKVHTRRLNNGEKADFFAFKIKGTQEGKRVEVYAVSELKTGLNVVIQPTEEQAVETAVAMMNVALTKHKTLQEYADAFNAAVINDLKRMEKPNEQK